MNKITHARQPASGFTLVEVMVAILVLSVGLLGLASLQANGLRQNASAYMRTQAIILANDMADRMRANPTQVAAGRYNNITATILDPGCLLAACAPNLIAEHDISTWYTSLGQLPSGTGTVTGDGRLFTIRVMWDDNKTGALGTGCDPNDPNDMVCFTTTLIP